jgi:glycosyltransferase involved in cell wall biosynthesis
MKVAMVTQFPRDANRPVGGVEAVSVNLARALAANEGVELHVVTLDDAGQRAIEDWHGVTVHRLPRPSGSMLGVARGAGRRLVSQHVASLAPDLVHAHDTYGIMVQGLRLPRVFTVHGFIYGDTLLSDTRFARLRSWLWKRVETAAWADQPNIVSISPYVRERVSQFSAAVIRDIDNPIAEQFFDTPSQPDPGRVFSAAVISQRKNTQMLVRAVQVLRDRGVDVQLRLAGPVVEAGYGKALQQLIDQAGLGDQVHLLGSIPSSRVLEELQRASAFALVSLEENSPMGIEEAMAMRLPVVSSNRCGMPYMIDHGTSGYLVDPFDAEDIAGALERSLARTAALGAESRRIAERRFHPREVARRTLEFYKEIL